MGRLGAHQLHMRHHLPRRLPPPLPQAQYGGVSTAFGPADLCPECCAAELRGLASASGAEGLRARALEMLAQVIDRRGGAGRGGGVGYGKARG